MVVQTPYVAFRRCGTLSMDNTPNYIGNFVEYRLDRLTTRVDKKRKQCDLIQDLTCGEEIVSGMALLNLLIHGGTAETFYEDRDVYVASQLCQEVKEGNGNGETKFDAFVHDFNSSISINQNVREAALCAKKKLGKSYLTLPEEFRIKEIVSRIVA